MAEAEAAAELDKESAVLDQAIQRTRDALDAARRAAAEGAAADERGAVESYRTLQTDGSSGSRRCGIPRTRPR